MAKRALLGMAMRQITCAVLSIVATACGGCSSSPPPPPQQMPPPTPQVPVGPPMLQPGPCDQAQSLAATTSIQARAAVEAPHMKPDAQAPLCGVVNEGQTVISPVFVIEPGYCYTFIGQSLPPVTQMEMWLQYDGSGAGGFLPQGMQGLANMAQGTLLVSQVPGEKVNMGEKQGCYQWGFPMPGTVKLVIKARAGSGPIAGQVFRKKL